MAVAVASVGDEPKVPGKFTLSLTKTIKAAQALSPPAGAPIRAFVLLVTELSMAFARLACRRNDLGRSQAASSSSSALASFRSSVSKPSVNHSALASFRSSVSNPSVNQP